MKKIRIGKDISLRWEITTDGMAIPLEGRDLMVEIKSPMSVVSNIPFRVDGNTIIMTYYGTEQKSVGEHSVTLWENKGKPGQNVVDSVKAFKLVKTTQEEDDFVNGDIQVESADLGTANFSVLTEGGYRAINIDTLQAEALEDAVNINGKTYSEEPFTITIPKANLDKAGVMSAADARTLQEHGDSIAQMKTSLQGNQSAIDSINTTLGRHGESISQINSTLQEHTEAIESNKTSCDGNAAEIERVSNVVATHEGRLDNIDTTLSNHTTSINIINNTLASHATQINDATENIESTNSALSALQGKVDANTTSISQINAELDNKDSEITKINTTLEEYGNSINANITTNRIADGAVTSEKLADSAMSRAMANAIADETTRATAAEQDKLNKSELPIKNVKESGIYFVDEQGNAFMIYSNEKGLDVSKISQEMANKVLAFLSIEQKLGDSPTSAISQKAVTDALTDIKNNIKIVSEVKEDGAFLCNEKGEVFARFVNGKFEAVGLSSGGTSSVENLEDIKNVKGGSTGQFLQKQDNGNWVGANISFPQPILSGLSDVNVNPVEGSILQYKGGKWVNAEISTEGLITTDSRANHPMYGKHFFVFGDSHTAPGFGLFQMLCKLTGAIYHTLIAKKSSDGTLHYFSATTSTTNYSELINEEDTGIEVNCDGFNWAQYAHAAYTYAQSKGFNVDYILVENCHFNKWVFYNEDGSLKENVPIILLNKTKVYSQIFEDANAVSSFISKDENVAKVVEELGFDSVDSSFILRYGTASQTLIFNFSSGNVLNTDCVAKIYFGDDTSTYISTELTQGMTLSECVDAINQWAFDEHFTWINPGKSTQGNTEILLNYSTVVGGDSTSIAKFEITNNANLIMQEPSIVANVAHSVRQYGLKDISGLRKASSWLASGGNVNWSRPNAMLGAMQYMGKYSPKTKFVFLGIWDNYMKEDYAYPDGTVNPYSLIKGSNYIQGQISKQSTKDIAEIFGWQFIDVDKLCGITPFNVTPTFNEYNNVHMKTEGYRVSAECIAKYIK